MSWWLIGSWLSCNVCLDSDYLVMLDLEIMAPLIFSTLLSPLHNVQISQFHSDLHFDPAARLRVKVRNMFLLLLLS